MPAKKLYRVVLDYYKGDDIAYIQLVDGEITEGMVKRSLQATEEIVIDFNNEDRILGVEVLNASKKLPPPLLEGL